MKLIKRFFSIAFVILRRSMIPLFKVIENPGRLFYLRGRHVLNGRTSPDSFSPEYYLLIQEEARVRFSSAIAGAKDRGLFGIPIFFIKIMIAYVQLKSTNALVQSIIQEKFLEERAFGSAKISNCDHQA